MYFFTQKACSYWPKEMKNVNLIIMDEHVQQMLHTSIFDGLWFRLLRVAIMWCKPNFCWIIQLKLTSNSLNNIIIGMKLWPWGMENQKTDVVEISMQLNILFNWTFVHNMQTLTIPKKNHHPLVSPKTGNAQPVPNKQLWGMWWESKC